jgi:hypothetical protein
MEYINTIDYIILEDIMAEKGINSSEFKFAGLVGLLTVAGEHLNIFDTGAFQNDPVLSLIFTGIQFLVLGGIVVAYIFSRTSVKVSNGHAVSETINNAAEGVKESIIEQVKRNLDQKR